MSRLSTRITDDYESGEGVHGAGRKLMRVDGEDGDKGPLDHQLDAKARFTAAMRSLGHAAGEVISAVVLSNWRLRPSWRRKWSSGTRSDRYGRRCGYGAGVRTACGGAGPAS